jgi:hypothetical protein
MSFNSVFLETKLTKTFKSYSLERYFRGHLKKNENFLVFFFENFISKRLLNQIYRANPFWKAEVTF